MYPETFAGFQVDSAETWTQFHKRDITPKPFDDQDIEVQITACGVCGSDVHTITGGWGPKNFPLCVGHEIVGVATRVGPKVTSVKVGDRVGVGAQIWSCLDCKQCREDNETYCAQQIDTYGGIWPGTDTVLQGGYASHIRAHEHWVFPIPAALPTNLVAPMLCAGLTAFSPLVRNGAGPGKKVGIVGLGGIGHFGILFSKALGATTYAISRTRAKEADARRLGADGFLATAEPGWNRDHRLSFDLIVNTSSGSEGFDLPAYLALLDVHGRWISVGLPEGEGSLIKNNAFMANGCIIGASHLGSRKEMLRMLALAAEKGIKPMVEEIPISPEGIKEAVTRVKKNDVKYRFVLTEFDKAFGA